MGRIMGVLSRTLRTRLTFIEISGGNGAIISFGYVGISTLKTV